jgi:hypothetical protein
VIPDEEFTLTMQNFLNNKLAFTAILLIFLAACGASMLFGSTGPINAHPLLLPEEVTTAHGPTMPPDPWEGTGSTLAV